MSRLCLEIVLALKQVSALAVWNGLYSSHRQYLDGLGEMEFDGKTCLARDCAKRIDQGGRPDFGVAWTEDRTIDYSHVTNRELSFVSVEGCIRDEEDAEAWLEPFAGDDAFRHARLFDDEYDFWQNAQDPLQYRTRGRSYEGLPMKPNGLPPPLDQVVIDISRNPGRRVLRRGVIEAIGCPMWLGARFWSITGANRDVVCGEKWLRCEAWRENAVRIRPAAAPFQNADGEAGRLQERVRSILFPAVHRVSPA